MKSPPMTKHIARTLERYPDGGQILKVFEKYYHASLTDLFSDEVLVRT